MAGEIGLFFPLVLRLQGGGVVDPAQEFDVVPEFMAQYVPQNIAGLCRVRMRIEPVKGALVHHDLPQAVTGFPARNPGSPAPRT